MAVIVILARGAEGSVLATPTSVGWFAGGRMFPVVFRARGGATVFVAGAVLAPVARSAAAEVLELRQRSFERGGHHRGDRPVQPRDGDRSCGRIAGCALSDPARFEAGMAAGRGPRSPEQLCRLIFSKRETG